MCRFLLLNYWMIKRKVITGSIAALKAIIVVDERHFGMDDPIYR